MLEGASLRIGLVMALLWLALPQTRQLKSKFLLAALAALFAIVSFRPKMLPVLVKVVPMFAAALFVLSLFRRQDRGPRPKSGARRPAPGAGNQENGEGRAPTPTGRGPG